MLSDALLVSALVAMGQLELVGYLPSVLRSSTELLPTDRVSTMPAVGLLSVSGLAAIACRDMWDMGRR